MPGSGNQVTKAPANEALDRPISLIDATRSREPENAEESDRSSRSPSWRRLAKRPTKDSVREGLARWKYSKWQQDRYASGSSLEAQDDDGAFSTSRNENPETVGREGLRHGQTDTSDFAIRQESQERGRKRLEATKDGAPRRKAEKQPYEVDILYENQRGWFLFGNPLYSHSSLLNLDPAPWQSKDGRDCAVNITNAQLPDPSWEWAWKTWYVDMSYDVDEEGWQYSFSFSKSFSWHGTHPWFHCFVRRRRWLRKRIKKKEMRTKDASDLGGAHTLTSDYFTIHTRRGKSPGSLMDNTTTRASSRNSRRTAQQIDLPPEDIKDVPSLMKALRFASIDREKIDAVKSFVQTGDEELFYLPQQIPEILDFLVFQVSRRQLLEYLNKVSDDAPGGEISDEATKKRGENLRRAARSANSHIGDLEYWSDRQQLSRAAQQKRPSQSLIFADGADFNPPKDDDPIEVIKGIADEAEVGVDSTKRVLSPPPGERAEPKPMDHVLERLGDVGGKEESEENSHEESEGITSAPRTLPPDSIKVDD